jgi:putative aminopeptidase FrvX
MHTPTEVLALSDIEDAVQILTRFVLDLKPGTDFTPA